MTCFLSKVMRKYQRRENLVTSYVDNSHEEVAKKGKTHEVFFRQSHEKVTETKNLVIIAQYRVMSYFS